MTAPAHLPDLETIPVRAGKVPFEIELRLRRLGDVRSPRHVLLLHGANTSSDGFLLPRGGLAGWLAGRGWQVWLLDWRGSPHVVDRLPSRPLGGSAIEEIRHFTVDAAAGEDVPAGLGAIRASIGPDAPLSVVGHCVGGGALAIAIARGLVEPFGVRRVVLSTLGLFYEVPWTGWIKAEDYVLERVLHDEPDCLGISASARARPDPRAWPWPREMERAYEHLPGAWLPDAQGWGGEWLRRLAFMIGLPFAPERIAPLRREEVEPIFGPLHLGLYLHLCQMVRRGFAAPLGAPDVVDRSRRRGPAPAGLRDYLDPAGFRRVETTLLSAAVNQVWHRDGVDLMHEWLLGAGAPSAKRVFAGANIQELLWGARAAEEVFPVVERGL